MYSHHGAVNPDRSVDELLAELDKEERATLEMDVPYVVVPEIVRLNFELARTVIRSRLPLSHAVPAIVGLLEMFLGPQTLGAVQSCLEVSARRQQERNQ